MAKALGVPKITAIEFGVGDGGGLLSMCRIAAAVQELTGVEIEAVGFDSGVGMPAPVDYRDHSEDYHGGDFAMDNVLDGRPDQYLPVLPVYFDDILHMTHNPWCGELLAIAESNASRPMRKLALFTNLRQMRVIKDAPWIPQMYALHVLDHAVRQPDFIKQHPRPVR